MQRANSPWARGVIHLLLILWVIYSVGPFIWAIIGSTQRTRDAIAREPRYVPQFIVDNPGAIVLLLALLVIGAAFWIRRSAGDDEEARVAPAQRSRLWPGVVIVIVLLAGAFLLALNGVDDNNVFTGSMNNYQELWLSADPADLVGYGIGLVALLLILTAVGVYARNLEKWRTRIYGAIAAIIVLVILWLPTAIQFAEFYDYFLNSVIVTVGTVLISISIGCLAGYGLARYSGIAGVVILFAALTFRALPRMAFILPYYYFAQISGLYDTYPLLIITFVAINQPFTIWMLRSFFMEIPNELEEAAMIDGCNRLTGFVRVIVPIVYHHRALHAAAGLQRVPAGAFADGHQLHPAGRHLALHQRRGCAPHPAVERQRGLHHAADRRHHHFLPALPHQGPRRRRGQGLMELALICPPCRATGAGTYFREDCHG